MNHPCGNLKCSTSTGIHDGLTFGSGRLDEHGYWEFPCAICAREFDTTRAETKARLLAEGAEPEHLEWLDIKGWPFPGQDVAKLSAEIKKHVDECDAEADEFDREMRESFPDLYEEEYA